MGKAFNFVLHQCSFLDYIENVKLLCPPQEILVSTSHHNSYR